MLAQRRARLEMDEAEAARRREAAGKDREAAAALRCKLERKFASAHEALAGLARRDRADQSHHHPTLFPPAACPPTDSNTLLAQARILEQKRERNGGELSADTIITVAGMPRKSPMKPANGSIDLNQICS
jgi:hypothetical protein